MVGVSVVDRRSVTGRGYLRGVGAVLASAIALLGRTASRQLEWSYGWLGGGRVDQAAPNYAVVESGRWGFYPCPYLRPAVCCERDSLVPVSPATVRDIIV